MWNHLEQLIELQKKFYLWRIPHISWLTPIHNEILIATHFSSATFRGRKLVGMSDAESYQNLHLPPWRLACSPQVPTLQWQFYVAERLWCDGLWTRASPCLEFFDR